MLGEEVSQKRYSVSLHSLTFMLIAESNLPDESYRFFVILSDLPVSF